MTRVDAGPIVPMTPYRVADGTYVIPSLLEAPPVGLFGMNSLVIQAAEPVIVDTGMEIDRRRWCDLVFDLVDPGDVRWIFLSHDDPDHAGNLLEVLDACPNAQLVTTWFAVGRLADRCSLPLGRVRFVRDGEPFEAGDRTLTAVRPPLFDNPVTRGLFDHETGVYWSVDTFALPLSAPTTDYAEMKRDDREDGLRLGARLIAPWHQWLDGAKWRTNVDRVRALPIRTVVSCHGPAIKGRDVDRAFEVLATVPELDPWTEFGQADLDAWLAAATD